MDRTAEPRTLADAFRLWYTAPAGPALIDARNGGARTLPAPEVARLVAGLGQGLVRLGLHKGDRVALICNDRPEWHVVDMAALHLGLADVPIYPTLQPQQIRDILVDSGARAAVVENHELLARVLEVRAACPKLEQVIIVDPPAEEGTVTLAEVIVSLDQTQARSWLEMRAAEISPDDLATLIYTSGTTGEPKGVMLTHDNFVFDALGSASMVTWPSPSALALAFLPLSHVLERLVDYIYFMKGLSLAYCGILESADALRRMRPNLLTAVPRFYEKVQDRVLHEASLGPGWKQALIRAALKQAAESVRRGRRSLLWRFFDLLVYKKIRAALGGRLWFTISGGAPLPVFVGEFFHGIGVKVLEGYGLTETSPVISVNRYDNYRLGTVGLPLPGVEVRIAPDGEVLTRGRLVMKGYWNRPDATAAVLDRDGWLATGDIGELDDAGFLRITDRKKDILVTAGGKNVAPQPIENHLKAASLVENAVLFGDRRPYVVALLVPNFEALAHWAESRGLTGRTPAELLVDASVLAAFQEIVDGVNEKLARFETIKKFRLIAEPFTIASGELTPTLKVKRRVIEKRHVQLIDAMYGEAGPAGAHANHNG